MKNKIIFLIIIMISAFTFSNEYKNSKIFFKRDIIPIDDFSFSPFGYYDEWNLFGMGPLFINNKEIIFYQITNEVIHKVLIIDIDNNKIKKTGQH